MLPENIRATQSAFAKIQPETMRRPTRIIVTFSGSRARFIFSRHHPDLEHLPSGDRLLTQALQIALARMGWKGTWVIGATKDGIVATCQEQTSTFTV